MYLLDTCTYLWLALDEKKLSEKVREIIQYDSQRLFVSSMLGFEIGNLVRKKRIELPQTPEEWIKNTLEFLAIEEIPVSYKIAVTSTKLSPIHNDPIDRMIIATAIENNLTILTPDANIHRYKNTKVVW